MVPGTGALVVGGCMALPLARCASVIGKTHREDRHGRALAEQSSRALCASSRSDASCIATEGRRVAPGEWTARPEQVTEGLGGGPGGGEQTVQ